MAPSAPLRVWQGEIPRHKCVIWACGRLLELFSICISSLFVVLLILLVIGGIETNPGPPENDVQDWEFDGVTQMTKEYKASRTVCGVTQSEIAHGGSAKKRRSVQEETD